MMQKTKKHGEPINVEIGQRLKTVRIMNGYTQEEFAEALSVSVVQYNRLENGLFAIGPDKLRVLYNSYKISPTFLVTGEQPEVLDIEEVLVNADVDKRNEILQRVSTYQLQLLKRRI